MDRPVGTLYGEVLSGRDSRRDFQVPITGKELMMSVDELTALLGDEKARVTFSQELSDKDYGNGYNVRVGVTLTCGQSMDEVQSAVFAAAELVSETLAGTVQQAKELDRALRTK